jgi:maltooligosyltrehalose trehalohydrolase
LILWHFYRELIRLRKEVSTLADLRKDTMEIKSCDDSKTLFIRRWNSEEEIFAVFRLGDAPEFFIPPLSYGLWHKELDSTEERWNGPGSTMPVLYDAEEEDKVDMLLPAHAFALFFREKEH